MMGHLRCGDGVPPCNALAVVVVLYAIVAVVLVALGVWGGA